MPISPIAVSLSAIEPAHGIVAVAQGAVDHGEIHTRNVGVSRKLFQLFRHLPRLLRCTGESQGIGLQGLDVSGVAAEEPRSGFVCREGLLVLPLLFQDFASAR